MMVAHVTQALSSELWAHDASPLLAEDGLILVSSAGGDRVLLPGLCNGRLPDQLYCKLPSKEQVNKALG